MAGANFRIQQGRIMQFHALGSIMVWRWRGAQAFDQLLSFRGSGMLNGVVR